MPREQARSLRCIGANTLTHALVPRPLLAANQPSLAEYDPGGSRGGPSGRLFRAGHTRPDHRLSQLRPGSNRQPICAQGCEILRRVTSLPMPQPARSYSHAHPQRGQLLRRFRRGAQHRCSGTGEANTTSVGFMRPVRAACECALRHTSFRHHRRCVEPGHAMPQPRPHNC